MSNERKQEANADFTPAIHQYQDMRPFRMWCQQVLPLVYSNEISYYEVLGKVTEYLNNVIQTMNEVGEDTTALHQAYVKLQNYVNNYFTNLDVQEEIDNKLDDMVESGELAEIVTPILASYHNPQFVTSTSQMVDRNKIYILYPAGKVYFWNGTTWQDSGITYGQMSSVFYYRGNVPSNTNLMSHPNGLERGYYLLSFGDKTITGKPEDAPTSNYGFLYVWYTGSNFAQMFLTSLAGNIMWISNISRWTRVAKNEDVTKIFQSRGALPANTDLLNPVNVPYGYYSIYGSNFQNFPEAWAVGSDYGWYKLYYYSESVRLIELTNSYGVTWINSGRTWVTIPNYNDLVNIKNMYMHYVGLFPVGASLIEGDDSTTRGYYTVLGEYRDTPEDWGENSYGWMVRWFKGNANFIQLFDARTNTNYVLYGNRWIKEPTAAEINNLNANALIYKGRASGDVTDISNLSRGWYTLYGNNVSGLPEEWNNYSGFLFVYQLGTNSQYMFLKALTKYGLSWVYINNTWILLGNTLQRVKISVIGDSITQRTNRATRPWEYLMSQDYKFQIQNLGIGGSGFANPTSSGNNRYINRISQINEDVELIGVSGSFNDMSVNLPVGSPTDTTTASLCGYINQFFDALFARFPTVPVMCYVLNPWGSYHKGVRKSDDYVEALETICAMRSIPFMSMYTSSNMRPWEDASNNYYFSPPNGGAPDATHPNNEGHKLIFRRLMPFFESCAKLDVDLYQVN